MEDLNKKHFKRLVDMMCRIEDYPNLDEYTTRIFGRPIKGSWRLYRHLVRTAMANKRWLWSAEGEVVCYYGEKEVSFFEEFATVILHETMHGLCYFFKENPSRTDYPMGLDEETICWNVSRIVCELLGIKYQSKIAVLCYMFHLARKGRDFKRMDLINRKLPAHLRKS